MRTREIIIGAIVGSVLLFVAGILVGLYGIPKSTSESKSNVASLATECSTTTYDAEWDTYRNKYLQKAAESSCYKATCDTEDLPRTYISYHLDGKSIKIDGKLDDPAWLEVPWTDSFMDIRGPDYPKPYFDTKVKVRWDDQRLYVGARMQETHFWGTVTRDETAVWKENAFELYIVPDGSLHNYKQLQINVMNVTWDLMLKKAYIDFATSCDRSRAFDSSWDSDMRKATFTDGIVNDINSTGTFWSAEWSLSFERLAQHTDRPAGKLKPDENEAWFFSFARPEYKYKIVNGKYVKDESAPTEWWSWQPTYAINNHLPSRIGLVQFKRKMNDETFKWEKWHLYRALFEVFEAEHKYKSVSGKFIDDMSLLQLAPKIMSSSCVDLSVTLNQGHFTVTAISKLDSNLPQAHIRDDRYVWFTN
ncbi:hypothetical protein ACF0H5_002914 [Mactra antiquata]